MISIDRLKEMALEDIEKNSEKHLEEYVELLQQLDQLEAENKELKKQVDITQMFLDACNNSCEHYKQTLAEIKEIVRKNYKTEEELFKIRHSRLPKFSMGALNGRHNLASEILQKISEVENG